jgi:hypothetical protein
MALCADMIRFALHRLMVKIVLLFLELVSQITILGT